MIENNYFCGKQKVFVFASSCYKRHLDVEKLKKYFKKNSWKVVDNPKKADVIIYNTCALVKAKEDESIEYIRNFKEYKKPKLIVAGCFPGINEKRLKKYFDGFILTSSSLNKIDQIFKFNKIKFKDVEDGNIVKRKRIFNKQLLRYYLSFILNGEIKIKDLLKDFLKNLLVNKDVYHIRISEGCLGNCSYCGIRNAIGTLRSKPLKFCLNEFKEGLKKGYNFFSISADDVGAYGIDIGITLPILLKEIIKIKGNYLINIQDLNPKWVVEYSEELNEIFKEKKFSRILVPIQSGSPRILKLMRRFNDVEKIKECILEIKKINPNIKFWTALIIGFPSETENDLSFTFHFVKDCGFEEVLIIKFSPRPDTLASKMENQIPEKIKDKRIEKAEKLFKSNKILPLSSKEADNRLEYWCR